MTSLRNAASCLTCGGPLLWSTSYRPHRYVHIRLQDVLNCPSIDETTRAYAIKQSASVFGMLARISGNRRDGGIWRKAVQAQPSMPGPVRAARLGIMIGMRVGLHRQAAAMAVMCAASAARASMQSDGLTDFSWLDDIHAEARRIYMEQSGKGAPSQGASVTTERNTP